MSLERKRTQVQSVSINMEYLYFDHISFESIRERFLKRKCCGNKKCHTEMFG